MSETTATETALGDLRVLDLAGPMGLYCTKQLADLGADVIRIEPPGGDPARATGPFYHDEQHPEKSLYWFHFNTSKRSVTLNVESTEGREVLRRLAGTADIIVETFQPGYMDSIGLGYAALREINPGLILTSITPFGQTGPYKDFKASDLIGLAMGGFLFICGWEDEPPTRVRGSQAYHMASVNACAATLIALHHRDMTGQGQHVDVSMQQSVAHALQWVTQMYDLQKRIMVRSGRLGVPLQECRDGWANMIALFDWDVFVDWLESVGEAADLADARYKDMDYQIRPEVRQHITEVTDAFTKAHDKRWIGEEGQKRHIISIPCNNARDVVENPQLVTRSFFADVDHPELRDTLKYPGAPYRLSRTPWRIGRRPPLVGEHNADIYERELGLTDGDFRALGEPAAQQDRGSGRISDPAPTDHPGARTPTQNRRFPLEGIRVADFSWYGAAPYATRLLAAYGAEVIRVESSAKLDGMRWQAPRKPDSPPSYNISGMFNNFNPGKLGITLNLNHTEARAIAKRLVASSDLVLDNFYPGAMEKWGLGYEELVKVKPDIIVATMPVMGITGPYALWRGFGTSIRTMAGIDYATGNPDRPPIGTGMAALPDFSCNPYHAATAILSALHYRNRTDLGQFIEIAQFESTVCWTETAILDYTVNGRIQMGMRNHLPYAAPHGVYRCLGEDGEVDYCAMPESVPERKRKDERWCAIAVFTDEEWRAFCKAMGDPPWAKEERFDTFAARKENEDDLDRLVEEWTLQRSPEEVMTVMQHAGVASGVVQDGQDLLTRDPQLAERGFYVYLDHPEAGRIAHDGLTFSLSATPGEIRRAPMLGEHNEYVYREILGLSEEELDRLTVEGVLE